jgi:hypothetical protein
MRLTKRDKRNLIDVVLWFIITGTAAAFLTTFIQVLS